jgi:hypothetical protein
MLLHRQNGQKHSPGEQNKPAIVCPVARQNKKYLIGRELPLCEIVVGEISFYPIRQGRDFLHNTDQDPILLNTIFPILHTFVRFIINMCEISYKFLKN